MLACGTPDQMGSVEYRCLHCGQGKHRVSMRCTSSLCGGDDAQGERWDHGQYVPDELLRRTWQWHLVPLVRQALPTEAVNPVVDTCCTPSPHGLGSNGQQGQGPSQSQSVAR